MKNILFVLLVLFVVAGVPRIVQGETLRRYNTWWQRWEVSPQEDSRFDELRLFDRNYNNRFVISEGDNYTTYKMVEGRLQQVQVTLNQTREIQRMQELYRMGQNQAVAIARKIDECLRTRSCNLLI